VKCLFRLFDSDRKLGGKKLFVIKFSTTKFHEYPLCGSWVFICMMLRRRDRLCDYDRQSAEKGTGLDILHLAPAYISVYFLWFLQEEKLLFLLISVHWLVIVKYRRVLCEVWNGTLNTSSINFVHERSKINTFFLCLRQATIHVKTLPTDANRLRGSQQWHDRTPCTVVIWQISVCCLLHSFCFWRLNVVKRDLNASSF